MVDRAEFIAVVLSTVHIDAPACSLLLRSGTKEGAVHVRFPSPTLDPSDRDAHLPSGEHPLADISYVSVKTSVSSTAAPECISIVRYQPALAVSNNTWNRNNVRRERRVHSL